ncbi:DUF3667 domain-containing protein [Hyunsoonleella pacifica]|uniref:DUF3667 domain-containing protein n=1 Tax=Hyunsoonleella pacifica TaxID=1080224 RepID=A0A4Q9FJP5_9FLAO|nr:DUF3667 domain-containing protein [Hyunsoonleella pacifica]TBN13152.1 DUF3667 domain-containing protein [Hyunsoonleella pacifica]GGD28626.1 hypothetical protein GCM10011368_33250 [Hyunsoonleella pacifica]
MECKNCGIKMQSYQNYCSDCGAKVIRNRLTFKNIWSEINLYFFNLDNKLFRTLLFLFTKPEEVIVSYIKGTRKKYVDVIQYFAIALTLVGIQVFLMNTFFKDAMDLSDLYGDAFKDLATQKNNPFSPENMDYSLINNYQSLIYVLSVPISAFSTWIAYFIAGERSYNFTEHIVINLYYSAQIIIVSAVLSILFLVCGGNYLTISMFVSLLTFAYLFYVLHRVFKASFLESFARFVLIGFCYVILFVFLMFVAVVGGYVFGYLMK